MSAELTSERVDQLLEQSRLEVEQRAARYGPDAMDALHEIATSADPGRVSKRDREWLAATLGQLGIEADDSQQEELLIEIRARYAKAPAAARAAAAKELVAQVRPAPKSDAAPGAGGTVVNVVINKLYAGQRVELPIAVSEAAMDAIEAGLVPIDGADFDGK